MADPLPVQGGILDPNNLSFASFLGGATPGSLDKLQRRRAIAQALASQKRGFPKNIGEGLTSLGEAIGDRMTDARLAAAEQSYVGDRATNPLFRQPGAPAPGATLGGLGGAAANPTLAAGDTSPQATLASGDPSG